MNKMADKKAKAGGMNKVGDGDSSGSKENVPNQMPGFSGNLYQSKWLMWYLLKGLSSQYKFELGTEIEAAGKYDDLVFKYKKVVDGYEKDHFIIMQAKHKTNVGKKITYQDVFTDGNGDFGFVKYFTSFAESKTAKIFKDGEIEHAIIYTNARFDMDGKIPVKDQNWNELKNFKNITEEMKLKQDDTLSAFKIKGGKFYQFKSDLVLPVLKSMVLDYEYYKIAQKLIECLNDKNKYLSLDDKILKNYNHLLLAEVIDRKSKMFCKDFLNENCDDVENDTGRKKLKRALDKVLHDEGLKIKEIAKNTFKWRKDFEKSGQKTQNWPTDIDDAYLKEFLKKSVFATEQPDERILGKTILDSLHEQFSTYDTDLIYSHFYAEIQDWMKGGHFFVDKSKNISNSKFISHDDVNKFFEHTIEKFNKIVLKGPIVDYDRHIQEYKIEFVDLEFDGAIKAFLDSDQRILSIISKHIMISSIKLYMKMTKIVKLEKFIYIKLSSSNNHSLNSAIETFELESTNLLLVIEWDYDETKLDDWSYKINDIINAIRINDHKKLIIVSNRDDILEKYFQDDFFVGTECEERKDTVNLLENFEKESQDRFLNATIKFQGCDAKFRDFITSDDLKKAIDGDILQKILKKEEFYIGKSLERLKEDIRHCYIDRTFMRKVENGENVYLLIGINELDLSMEYQNFEIIKQNKHSTRNESDTFKRVANENKSNNVYLLRKESKTLILLEKSTDEFEESDFRNAMKCEDNKCEINLITAVAGTGKSTLFIKLSQKIKDKNPELWVVKIDLNAMSTKLNEILNSKQNIQLQTVIELLHHGAKHQSELEKKIFEHRLQSKNVELFLDGFDEVCPSYKSIVLKMIQILQNDATIKTTWISTRPYDSILNDMKETFSNFYVKYYNFEPLTEDIQKRNLKNFWRQSIIVEEEFFKRFVEELFKLLNNNIRGDFLGLPLHTMLIGITFKDTYGEFQNIGKSEISTEQRQKLSEMVNLSSLYDKFVKYKCEIYCKEKINLNLDTEAGKQNLNNSLKSCLKQSKILALDSLLNENELKILLTETELNELKEYKEEIEGKGDLFGIVNQIVDGKPQFIHRTFAEYFVAMFFIENFKREEKESRKYVEYFLENMIGNENSVICGFIDSKLDDESNFIENGDNYGNVVKKMNGGNLFIVLEKRWQNIGEILIKNGINVNFKSIVGTILHSASKLERSKNKQSILSLILEKRNYEKNELKSELLKTDEIFGNTPLLVAAYNGIFNNVKIIFEICKKMKILDDIITQTNRYHQNIIHLSVDFDDTYFSNLLNLLKTERGTIKVLLTKKNMYDETPFDTAVVHRQKNKFEAMLNLCGEFHISTDSVLFIESKNGGNIIHSAATNYCNDDYFTNLLNLIKSDHEKLKAFITQKDNNGETPFHTAAKNGQQNKYEAMLNLCEELNIFTDSVLFNETKNGKNIMHLAAVHSCNDNCFTYLLNLLRSEPRKLEALLTQKDNNGYTSFHTAVYYGQPVKFETMWNLFEELDISTDSFLFSEINNGENIMHLAATDDCNDDFITNLLSLLKSEPRKLKALLIKKNNDGKTPIVTAVENSQQVKFETMLNLCGELDISIDSILLIESENGGNIIHLATGYFCNEDFFINLLKLLKSDTVKLKALLTKKDNDGKTPFDAAVKNSQRNKLVAMLNLCEELEISTDCILSNKTINGKNIMHLAAVRNYDDYCFTYLLNLLRSESRKFEALLTQKDNDGYTPFDIAVYYGEQNKLEAILNLCRELDISIDSILFNETKNGKNILNLAADLCCNDDCFTYLLTLLRSEPSKLKALLTQKDNDGFTPFDIAVYYGEQNKFKAMLNLCRELDISTDSILFNETKNGKNVMSLAADCCCNDFCFFYLLNLLRSEPSKLKVLLTKKDNDGYTPFDTAVKYGQQNKFEIMLNLCGKLDISADSILFNEAENGENIIHLAAGRDCNDDCYTYLLKLLRSYPDKLKALLTKNNNEGRSPFDVAEGQEFKLKFLQIIWDQLESSSSCY